MKILVAKKGTWSANFRIKNLKEENGELFLEKNDGKNLIALFPTRSGFTTNIVIPTVLSHNGNMIIFDFKNEVYNETAKEMKNKKFKVYNIELDNVNSNNEGLYKSDIENLLKEDKFVLYIGIKEIRKIEILAKNRIVDFILGRVQELNIGCLTIFDECSIFFKYNENILPFVVDNRNNQFILKFQALQQSLDLVLENANKPNGIKIPEYDIFSINLTSKDYSERSYNYIKNGEIEFVHIKE